MDNWLTWLLGSGGLAVGFASALCTALVPLAIVGAFAVYLIRRNQKSKAARQAARSWATTEGVVLTSTIRVRQIGRSRTVLPVVVYRYEVDGVPHTGQVVRAGDEHGRILVAGDAEAIIARYPVGSRVKVLYDSAHPDKSALEV